MDTALWITANDMKGYFYLSNEILRVQMVPRFAKRRTFFDKHANVAKLQFFSEGIYDYLKVCAIPHLEFGTSVYDEGGGRCCVEEVYERETPGEWVGGHRERVEDLGFI